MLPPDGWQLEVEVYSPVSNLCEVVFRDAPKVGQVLKIGKLEKCRVRLSHRAKLSNMLAREHSPIIISTRRVRIFADLNAPM